MGAINQPLLRRLEDWPTPCEVYKCKPLCKKGMACASFRGYVHQGSIRPPVTPDEKMYKLIYGEE